MRFTCNSLNLTGRNQAIWIAIYCSVVLIPSTKHSATHTTLLSGIVACAIFLGSVAAAWYVCRKRRTAA